MDDLRNLIEFIECSPDPDLGETYVSTSVWETELTKSIPSWRRVIKDSDNWARIEKIRPKRNYGNLCRAFLQSGGVKLAKRWFHSDVPDQRDAAERWLTIDAAIDASLWCTLDRRMKDHLFHHTFTRFPGEPFQMLEEYSSQFRDIIHRLDHSYVPVAIPIVPHIVGYVCSPQIQKLRSVIEDANDCVYLNIIDAMISRRVAACKVASFQQQIRVPYTPNSNERELIARVMEITRLNGYLPAALPPIFISYETPPIFIAYPELEDDDNENQMPRDHERIRDENQIPRNRERRRPETISIEELLGVYQSHHEQIIIYERGIKWRGHQYDEEWLRAVVLIHEIGHWITHMLPKPGVPTWSTDLFALSETDLKEGWAQLITWWIAKQVGGAFRDTVEKLNGNQSPPYHVFEQFKDEPIDKVMASLERLRGLPWPGRLQDWKSTLRV